MTWPEFWHMFHRRWGSDHESPEYVKAEWNEMQRFLEDVEGITAAWGLPDARPNSPFVSPPVPR